MLLGSAGMFVVVAVVFGALAFTRSTTQPASGVVKIVKVPITLTMTPPAPSPSPGSTPVPSSSPAPTTVVVTVTTTRTVAERHSGGVNVGSLESGASTLGTVVAAACAVIALRPQRRTPPPAGAGAPVSTPGA